MEKTAEKPATLLDELDARQNDVIRRLDELNLRIEETLKCWTARRAEDEE